MKSGAEYHHEPVEQELTVSTTIGTPQDVYAWVKNLIAESQATGDEKKVARLKWELGNIISETAPGADKATEAILLKEDNATVGAALLAPAHLIGVFVRPNRQRQGYGKTLIETGLQHLLEQGAKSILVEIADQRLARIIKELPPELQEKLILKEAYLDS